MITKQKKWHLKKMKEGKCISCGGESGGRLYCQHHMELKKIYDRQNQAKKRYGYMWEVKVVTLQINDEIRRLSNG